MSASKQVLATQSTKLRRQIAESEATLENLKAKLAAVEAKLTGKPAATVNGLDLLWKIALPIARNRSTKQQCRVEWNKIPKGERPPVQTLLDALKIWNRSTEWKKDGNSFVPGLHRWIKNRAWEDLPEVEAASSRYRSVPKPLPQNPAEESATPEEIAAILGAIQPRRMNS